MTSGLNGGLIGIFPIIICRNDSPGAVMKFKSRISQNSIDAKLGQTGADGANDDFLRLRAANDETARLP